MHESAISIDEPAEEDDEEEEEGDMHPRMVAGDVTQHMVDEQRARVARAQRTLDSHRRSLDGLLDGSAGPVPQVPQADAGMDGMTHAELVLAMKEDFVSWCERLAASREQVRMPERKPTRTHANTNASHLARRRFCLRTR
jgi:hypothetical protein